MATLTLPILPPMIVPKQIHDPKKLHKQSHPTVYANVCKTLCYKGQSREYICKKAIFRNKICYYHFHKKYPFTPLRRVVYNKKKPKKNSKIDKK